MLASYDCCTGLLLPFNPNAPNSFISCNPLVPNPCPPAGGGATDCTGISCVPFTPVCFTPTSYNLCGYLAGIDQAICAINVSLSSINCSSVLMNGAYTCILGYNAATAWNLCQFALAVNSTFCYINKELSALSSQLKNLVIDGNNGTLTVATGLSAGMAQLTDDKTITHGASIGSQKMTAG